MNIDLLSNLPEPTFGNPEALYDCGCGSAMMTLRDVSLQDYYDYCRLLEGKGFIPCGGLTLENCFGKTYSGEGVSVQCNYREFERTMRVIADEQTLLPAFEKPCVCEKNQTRLIQFETDHSLIDCGMCYIFCLCDGSFFIIDSGHSYSVDDEKRLHGLLRSKTPKDEKIVIAGWFFTHGHDDHVDKACDYLKTMCEDTVVEGLYFNFPSVTHRDSENWGEDVRKVQDDFCTFVKNSGFRHFNIHSMQRFYVRNLEIDVLCTHEDVYPGSLRDYNDSSSVIMVKAAGNKILFPGDASFEESDILTASFSEDTLSCDICQLSHHGHFGCKPELYRRCNHRILLIPNTEIKLNEELDRVEADRVAMDIAREYYISSHGTVEIPLPYEKGRVEIYPDETTESFEEIYKLWGYRYPREFKEKIKSDFILRSKK